MLLKKKIILSLCPFSEIMTLKKNFKHSFKVLDTNSDLILATFALIQVSFVIINDSLSLTVYTDIYIKNILFLHM